MCRAADFVKVAGIPKEAAKYYQRARDVGVAHGFFSVERSACLGLGRLAMAEGRAEEGMELLRNALEAARLSEDEGEEALSQELDARSALIEALFTTNELEELEEMVSKFRLVAEATANLPISLDLVRSFYFGARLHEVVSAPRVENRECLSVLVRASPSPCSPLHSA